MNGDPSSENWRDLEELRRGVLREVNERIASLSWRFAGRDATLPAQFICECSDPACTERVEVALVVYERVRAQPRRYLIVTNHQNPETETVIASAERCAIVEALAGKTSKIAEEAETRAAGERFTARNGERGRPARAARPNETPA